MRILAANPGLDPSNLQIGQVLCIFFDIYMYFYRNFTVNYRR
nr:LysM domain-containing protein [Paenibacillus phocaensis]